MHEENWVDKEFELGRLMEEMPDLLNRLRAVPREIEQQVEAIPAEEIARRLEGEWSVQEHIGHLADLEELHEGRLDDFEANVTTLRPADMTNRKTEEAHHNEATLAHLISSFKDVRTRFVQRIEGMNEDVLARSAIHPRLRKPMRPVDLAYFVVEHDAHHLAAIACLCNHTKG